MALFFPTVFIVTNNQREETRCSSSEPVCVALGAKKRCTQGERVASRKEEKEKEEEEEQEEVEEEWGGGSSCISGSRRSLYRSRESARYSRIHYTWTLASSRTVYTHAEYRRPGRCTRSLPLPPTTLPRATHSLFLSLPPTFVPLAASSATGATPATVYILPARRCGVAVDVAVAMRERLRLHPQRIPATFLSFFYFLLGIYRRASTIT